MGTSPNAKVTPSSVTQDAASIHELSDTSAARSSVSPAAQVAKPKGKTIRDIEWDEEGETRKPTNVNQRRTQQDIENLKLSHSLGEKILELEMAAKQDEAHRKLQDRLHRKHHHGSEN